MGDLFYTELHVQFDALVKAINLYFPNSQYDTGEQIMRMCQYDKYNSTYSYPINMDIMREILQDKEDYDKVDIDLAEKLVTLVPRFASDYVGFFFVDF